MLYLVAHPLVWVYLMFSHFRFSLPLAEFSQKWFCVFLSVSYEATPRLSMCPVTGDVNFEHLVKVLSPLWGYCLSFVQLMLCLLSIHLETRQIYCFSPNFIIHWRFLLESVVSPGVAKQWFFPVLSFLRHLSLTFQAEDLLSHTPSSVFYQCDLINFCLT